MEIIQFSQNEKETQDLAALLATLSQPGDVYLLEGELGAGKTTFTKGFGKALGITRVIKSPTYTLIREYTDGRLPLYHMDLYRLEAEGADDLGLEEYFASDGVTLIEWGSVVSQDMPNEYLLLEFSRTGESNDGRQIRMVAIGKKYTLLLEKIGHHIKNV